MNSIYGRLSFIAVIGLSLLLPCGGCAPAARHAKRDLHQESAVEVAARSSGERYLGRLSAACRESAAKSNELKSWAELYDGFHDASEKARTESFAEFEDAITTALLKGENTPYDPAAVNENFSRAADGFERAANLIHGKAAPAK